ncbi:cytochrome C oxidase subunit IV family protein [Flavihumibacter profundi]|uniref:cytochrome C oxidase subunit IV family protein n=1 Tax=Flavihumibacter profundi TaxID=2716883 RepID=UPI001CC70CCA|nr:cytochrome C oxidase subunit IV family protein [Flavihumibacter profundi]MBZ5858968.1 cytochrome C oxidase subunit IV family protein [Flavihumibacter profundi]
MENIQEITHHHSFDREAGKKEVIRVTVILTVFTLIELALGFWLMGIEAQFMRHLIKGVICILMLAKAFYIVGYFMHLKHELRNMIMTIVVPLLLFFWFIIAFLADGNSYKNLKNKYDPYHLEQSKTKVEAPAHEGGEHPDAKKEGSKE